MEPSSLTDLEQRIQYEFKDKSLLEEALRHSSYVNEQAPVTMQDNERLEFLGDAVLSLSIGHLLMHHYPELKEGELSRMRSQLVNESQLSEIAQEIYLGGHIKLGKGELQTNGYEKPSILADAFEALLAAVYLDGGFDAALHLIRNKFTSLILSEDISMANQDYKSRLQEFVQTTSVEMPHYQVTSERGPDHDKTFIVQLKIEDILTEGEGKSKKIAEQEAARKAFAILRENRER